MKTLLSFLFTVMLAASAFAQDSTAAIHAVTTPLTGSEDFVNYHAMVVHFPIVLLILGALLAMANLYFRRKDFDTLVVVIAFAGAIGTIIADQTHPHVIRNVDPVIRAVVKTHDQQGDLAKLFAVLSAIFLVVSVFYRKAIVKYIGIALLVVSAVFVGLAGHEGAKLVHIYDVGPKGNLLNLNGPQGPPPGEGHGPEGEPEHDGPPPTKP